MHILPCDIISGKVRTLEGPGYARGTRGSFGFRKIKDLGVLSMV
ncbi:MAG: hypothetical protein ACJATN_001724 [Neolewinella sp.]|jgi:hypothetical protein